jgi:hypothetical protein
VLARRLPEVLQSPGETLDRPGAAEGGEAVSGDGSGHAGDVTDHGGGGVLTSGASLGVPNVCRAAGLRAFEQIAS